MRKKHRLEFIQDVDEEPIKVNLVLYPTARSILEEFGSTSKLFKKKKILEGYKTDGTMWEAPLNDAIKHIKSNGVWGFFRFKEKEIHLWFRKNVKERELQRVLAHEMGHWFNPHPHDMCKEEQKAVQYEFVTEFAYDVTKHLIEGVKKGVLK